jgi:hypothetical protein
MALAMKANDNTKQKKIQTFIFPNSLSDYAGRSEKLDI